MASPHGRYCTAVQREKPLGELLFAAKTCQTVASYLRIRSVLASRAVLLACAGSRGVTRKCTKTSCLS